MIITEIIINKKRVTISVKDDLPIILSTVSYQTLDTILGVTRLHNVMARDIESMRTNTYVPPYAKNRPGDQDLDSQQNSYREQQGRASIKVFGEKRLIQVDRDCTTDCIYKSEHECYRPPGVPLDPLAFEIEGSQNEPNKQGQDTLKGLVISNEMGIHVDYRLLLQDNSLLAPPDMCYTTPENGFKDAETNPTHGSQVVSHKDFCTKILGELVVQLKSNSEVQQTKVEKLEDVVNQLKEFVQNASEQQDKPLKRIFSSVTNCISTWLLEELKRNQNQNTKQETRFGLLSIFKLGIQLDDIEKFKDKKGEVEQLLSLLKDIMNKVLDNDIKRINEKTFEPEWIDLEFLKYLCEMKQELEKKKKKNYIEYGLHMFFPSKVEHEIFSEPLRNKIKEVLDELSKLNDERYNWAKNCKEVFEPDVVVGGLLNPENNNHGKDGDKINQILERWDANVFLTLDPIAIFSPWAKTRDYVLGEKPRFEKYKFIVVQYAKPYICEGSRLFSCFNHINDRYEREPERRIQELLKESLRSPLLAIHVPGDQLNSNDQNQAKRPEGGVQSGSLEPNITSQVNELMKLLPDLENLEDVLPIDIEEVERGILVKAVGPDVVLLNREELYKFLKAFPNMIKTKEEFKEWLIHYILNNKDSVDKLAPSIMEESRKKAISISRERGGNVVGRRNII